MAKSKTPAQDLSQYDSETPLDLNRDPGNLIYLDGLSTRTEGYYPCRNGEMVCDIICRCYTITSAKAHVTPSAASALLERLLPNYEKDSLNFYCLERCLRKYLSSDMFTVHWGGDYYGDEVTYVLLDRSSSSWYAFLRGVEDIFEKGSPDLFEIVQRTLLMEYTYLLPDIQEVVEWEIKTLSFRDLYVPPDTLNRVDQEIVQGYKYHPPCHKVQGVAIFDGEKYRLVDGFHRFSAWSENRKGKINVLCGVKE